MTNQSEKPNFKELLDLEYNWPDFYTFKMIVPVENLSLVHLHFSEFDLKLKESSKGNYVSITFRFLAQNSDEILELYERAKKIPKVFVL